MEDIQETEHHENSFSSNSDSTAVVIFGYTILDYARKYDRTWIRCLNKLRSLYDSVYRKHLSFQFFQPNKFPHEMVSIREVFSYLDGGSLLQAAQVCRLWNSLADDNHLWEHLLIEKYNLSRSTIISKRNMVFRSGNKPPTLWAKEMYKTMFLSFRSLIREQAGFRGERPSVPMAFLSSGILA
jgi:hypothetical protein